MIIYDLLVEKTYDKNFVNKSYIKIFEILSKMNYYQ